MKLSQVNPLTTLAKSRYIKKAVNWACENSSKKNRYGEPVTNLQLVKKHFPTTLTAVLSALFINDTLRSREIPKDKKQSLVNFYTVNALFIIGSTYAIMPYVERFTKELGTKFNRVNMENSERIVLEKGLKSMIPIVAICITSRIISPFISSALSDASKLIENKQNKKL